MLRNAVWDAELFACICVISWHRRWTSHCCVSTRPTAPTCWASHSSTLESWWLMWGRYDPKHCRTLKVFRWCQNFKYRALRVNSLVTAAVVINVSATICLVNLAENSPTVDVYLLLSLPSGFIGDVLHWITAFPCHNLSFRVLWTTWVWYWGPDLHSVGFFCLHRCCRSFQRACLPLSPKSSNSRSMTSLRCPHG